MDKEELQLLIQATGLPQAAVARKLDVLPTTLNRWIAGTQKISHPPMLKKALQMIALEQSGHVTNALVKRTHGVTEKMFTEFSNLVMKKAEDSHGQLSDSERKIHGNVIPFVNQCLSECASSMFPRDPRSFI